MIYDGFIFFNELELLELRLEYLYDVVDKFILVESKYTFTNEKKELYYEINKNRYEKWSDKIIHIVIDEFPDACQTAWDREHYQRNAIEIGIKDASDYDIFMSGDLDEIPSRNAISRMKKLLKKYPEKVVRFELLNCWYYMNYIDTKTFFDDSISACRVKEYYEHHMIEDCVKAEYYGEGNRFTPMSIRCIRDVMKLPCAGWHFSYMGGIERITKKIQSFAHQEYNNDDFLDSSRIEKMIATGNDIFGFGITFRSVPVGILMPDIVRKNQAKYNTWICNFNPLSKKQLFKLYIKYICETTCLHSVYKTLKRTIKKK